MRERGWGEGVACVCLWLQRWGRGEAQDAGGAAPNAGGAAPNAGMQLPVSGCSSQCLRAEQGRCPHRGAPAGPGRLPVPPEPCPAPHGAHTPRSL